jgi:hypothetical protein
MTHTLHRMGSRESLSKDFVILMMPSKDINHEGSGPKLRRLLKICLDKGAIKVGDARLGNPYHQGGLEQMLANIEDRAVVQAVFNDSDKLLEALRAIKEADLGMSVVVSGLFDKVEECCQKAGLQRHTVNESLGRWGKVDKLPPAPIMEINTMCGHGMVAASLIEEALEKVKAGELTPEEAGERLFNPCMCGIFNSDRAARLLRKMAEES